MLTTQQISDIVGGQLAGKSDVQINAINKIENAKSGSVSFIANAKFIKYLKDTQASAIIIDSDFDITGIDTDNAVLIKVKDVYAALSKLLRYIEKENIETNGISPLAFVDNSVNTGDNVHIGAFSYISANAVIGNNVKIATQVFIGKNVKLGDNVCIYPGVKIYNNCIIGNDCIIHANAVIGSDGFGFKPNEKGEYEKIPQVGKVVIEDNVEIGANTVIDRATFGETVIHRGVKLDNLIQVAHNVEIGENSVIAAQTGIAGSTKLGKNLVVGGQAGFNDHIIVADGNKFQAKSGVLQNIKSTNGRYQGAPAIDYYTHMKASVIFKSLPELQKKILQLEKQLQELTEKSNNKDDEEKNH